MYLYRLETPQGSLGAEDVVGEMRQAVFRESGHPPPRMPHDWVPSIRSLERHAMEKAPLPDPQH